MNINLANFKKLTVALAVLGLAVVGTYAVRAVVHRSSPAIAGAHTGEIVAVAFAAAPPLQAPKQTSNAIPDRVYGALPTTTLGTLSTRGCSA